MASPGRRCRGRAHDRVGSVVTAAPATADSGTYLTSWPKPPIRRFCVGRLLGRISLRDSASPAGL